MKLMQFSTVLNINLEKISFVTFFIIVFYEVFIKLRSFYYPFKMIYRKLLWHCPTIQFIYISVIKIWCFYIFIIIFHIFLLAFVYLWITWHTPLLISFSTVNIMSASVTSSYFTSVFFKTAFHANPESEINFTWSNS